MSPERPGCILITGGTGFVGSHLVRMLVDQGARLKLVVRPASRREFPPGIGANDLVTTPDLFAEDGTWWAAACADVDTIIHLAWYVEPGVYLDSPLNLNCLAGTLALARGAAEAGVRRIVGIGTCAEYDTDAGLLTTETALRPTTLYAATKAAAFTVLAQWTRLHRIEFAWCRLFYLHGRGEHPSRLVPYLHARLSAGLAAELTSGEQVRDFIDVEDAARQIMDVCQSHDVGVFNICSGVPVTVRQMAESIADMYGRRDLLRFGVRPNSVLDPPMVVGVPRNRGRSGSESSAAASVGRADARHVPGHTTSALGKDGPSVAEELE